MCAKAHRLDFCHMLSVQVQPYLNKNTVLFIYKGNRIIKVTEWEILHNLLWRIKESSGKDMLFS